MVNFRTVRPDTLFYVALLAVMMLVFSAAGCGTPQQSGEEQAARNVEQNVNEMYARHGTAEITNYQEYALAKRIQELRDREDLTTYTYTINRDGERRLYCESIGYGLPYATQTTNPMQSVDRINGGDHTIPQAEPNGLYFPDNVDATWINCVDDDGSTYVDYVEQQIAVSPRRKETP